MKLWQLFRPRSAADRGTGHMTFAGSQISHTVARTALLLKKQLWVWPLVAIALLSVIGYSVRSAIERTMRANLESQLKTLLDVEVAMLENWANTQHSNAETMANDPRLRAHVYSLLKAAGDDAAPPAADAATPREEIVRDLRRVLGPSMTSHDYYGFFIANRSKEILAATQEDLLGRKGEKRYDDFLTRVFDGETVVSAPFLSVTAIENEDGENRAGTPTMFVCAPVRDESFQVVAALALRIRPDREFTRIMRLGEFGDSGETYAFNRDGLMVTNSRFDDELILLGVLPDEPNSKSILRLLVRDPGQNITESGRPRLRRSEMPMTRMATAATAGRSGVDVDGYRDYRGVPVVGAWTWLPHLNLGVATEIDHAEAFRPLSILQTAFWSLYALLALAAVAIFVFTLIVTKLQRQAQQAAIDAKELGQYKLLEKLGAGAMGVVYRGIHAMLRRPTAIKMLNVDKVNDASIQRFEREVQITCQLNHPNTIAIYDYGRTPEGVFYYAMEFLDGIDLQHMVDKYGPLPEGRVIHILKQVCGSLYEAHTKGLVHRDIKPSNIMLNRRGGEADVVKVLDFGLVKALDQEKQAGMTNAGALTGTPLYMSPEAIQSPNLVDACSDLYAVGAVGYFLLTGQPLFNSPSVVDLLQQHVSGVPISPSQRSGREIGEELEYAILACVEKDRSKRPQTARILAQLLDKSPAAGTWTWEDADAWWGRHERGTVLSQTGSNGGTPHAKTTPGLTSASAHEQTMVSNVPLDE